MSDGKKHGTDCFEVDSFLQKNGTSKMYQVRHKENGKFYTMEVSLREPSSKAPVSPYVQKTRKVLSEFWVNLRFTFQTRSKFYYILDHAGNQTLSQLVKLNGFFPESTARFYASEIVVCLEEFHNSRLVYRELDLESVYVDSKGHVVIWRSFCDKLYWSKLECVCSLAGFRHGDPCNNNHDLRAEFKSDWISLGNLLLAMLTGQSHQQTHFSTHPPATQQTISLPHILSASASDLIRRLVRGDIYRSEQVQSHPFFRGIDWHEVRKRKSRAPGFHLNLGSEQEPSSRRSSPRHASIDKEQFTTSELSSPYWRPHSSSFYSDPGRPMSAKHHHGHMMHHPGLHSAVSTPDLSSWGRDPPVLHQYSSSPVGRMRSNHGVPDYSNFATRGFQVENAREQERRPLVSRSLSDLSSFCGSDAVILPSSPTSFQRTVMDANFHGATLYGSAKDFGNWSSSLVRSGSQGDLSASYVPESSPYNSTYGGRSSPTPSQYSDYSSYSSYSSLTSPRGLLDSPYQSPRSQVIDYDYGSRENDNVFASGYQVFGRSSPREFESHRQILGSPNHSGRGQFSFYSGETRPDDSSSSHREVSANRSSTNYSTNLVKEEREFTTRNDGKRTSNEVGRERTSSLSRTLSCSYIGDQKQRSESEESTSDRRRESLPFAVSGLREKYPLAQVPIPSFREFRNRIAPSDSVEKDKTQKEAKDGASNNSGRINQVPQTGISTFRNEEETDSKLQNRLSSLYESSKDISGHSKAKRLSESSKSLNVPDRFNAETLETSCTPSTDGKESPRKYSKNRQESPFSKNEVIHQLMLKYGLYEKNNHRKAKSPSSDAPEEQERNGAGKVAEGGSKSPRSKKRLSHRRDIAGESETSSPGTNRRAANKSSPRSLRKNADTSRKDEGPKSTSAALNEMTRKNSLTINSSEEVNRFSSVTESTFNRKTVEPETFESSGVETEQQEKDKSNARNNNQGTKNQRNDLDSTMADTLKARAAVRKSGSRTEEIPANKGDDSVVNNSQFSEEKAKFKRPRSMYNTSRTILYATKFKKAVKNKAEKVFAGSPLPDRKSVKEIIISSDVSDNITNNELESTIERKDKTDEKNDEAKSRASVDELSPDYRRQRFRRDNGLHKRRIHTSMLSVASSFYSSDNDIDDAISIQSEVDSLDGERATRGRRWDSFYSNVSADSGSAHMFEYETDSAATEFEEVFDDQDSGDEQPKGEVDVERADSGVGGDMGQSPMRRSWEEIMMKSSEHWSVVAASARHWQELARRKRVESSTTNPSRKKQSINENMVECPDCLKHYLPPKEKETSNNPQICSKCKDRRIERKEAIIELVQTEINYGNDLQVLKEEFYVPMQSGGILSPENLAAIFLNLQELLEVNSKFCVKLQKSLEDSVAKGDEEFAEVNVGSIFLESVDFFQAYEIYCSKQNAASSLLDSLQKKTELLRIFLNVTCRENPKCRKMDLNSFILAPVQRIMKYPLLLSRICKASPRRNPDREKLKVAQRRIEEQLNKINALNTAIESRQKRYRASQQLGRSESLDKVQMKKMASDILSWTMEEMQLLMHGVFQVNIHEFNTGWNRRGSKKALSVCVLFCVRGHSEHVRIDSDDEGESEEHHFPGEGEVTDAALLLLRKKINGKYTLFREPLYLDMCVIYRDCERKDSFEIVIMGKESYVFRAQSTKECRRWLKYLRIESKDIGTWKRRRNGLPNIMIKNL